MVRGGHCPPPQQGLNEAALLVPFKAAGYAFG